MKAANPQLSVCQIGATIGRMWRELSEAEKQRHLEEFQQDKVSCLSFSMKLSISFCCMCFLSVFLLLKCRVGELSCVGTLISVSSYDMGKCLEVEETRNSNSFCSLETHLVFHAAGQV